MKRRIPSNRKDRDTETQIRELVRELRTLGLSVRREELSGGPGWRASSGECIIDGERVLIVDRRTELVEQLRILTEARSAFRTGSAEISEGSLPELSAPESQAPRK